MDPGTGAAPRPTRWLGELTSLRIAVASSLGVAAAFLLNPLFATSLWILLVRSLFLSWVLLCVFIAAGRWRQRLIPRWVMQVIAVALTAPLATLLVYLVSSQGDWRYFLSSDPMLLGYHLTAASTLVIGTVIALGALVRERDASARAQAIAFELERERLQRQAADARLSLLQAQIEPHFLFNTLANVQALVESGSTRAPAVLASLINYLRAAMPRLREESPTLGNELALVRAYLDLMQMRMPDRLQVSLVIDPQLTERRFPPMALLTLVENAVHHGIDPAEDGGAIEVGARLRDDQGLRVWVSDTGVGMAEGAAPGTGLRNLEERLRVFFSGQARLEWSANSPHGLRAAIVLPAQERP